MAALLEQPAGRHTPREGYSEERGAKNVQIPGWKGADQIRVGADEMRRNLPANQAA